MRPLWTGPTEPNRRGSTPRNHLHAFLLQLDHASIRRQPYGRGGDNRRLLDPVGKRIQKACPGVLQRRRGGEMARIHSVPRAREEKAEDSRHRHRPRVLHDHTEQGWTRMCRDRRHRGDDRGGQRQRWESGGGGYVPSDERRRPRLPGRLVRPRGQPQRHLDPPRRGAMLQGMAQGPSAGRSGTGGRCQLLQQSVRRRGEERVPSPHASGHPGGDSARRRPRRLPYQGGVLGDPPHGRHRPSQMGRQRPPQAAFRGHRCRGESRRAPETWPEEDVQPHGVLRGVRQEAAS